MLSQRNLWEKAKYVNQAVLEYMKLYPIKSLTADNGKEFLSLSKIEGLDVYLHKHIHLMNDNELLRVHSEGTSLKELNQNLLEDYKRLSMKDLDEFMAISPQKSCLS